jgi:cation transporter-like permease
VTHPTSEFSSAVNSGSSYEDRRRAAGEATGCRNVVGIVLLGLWSALFLPVGAGFFLDMLHRAGRGAFDGPELIEILALLEFCIPMLLGWWTVAQSIRASRHPSEAGALLVADHGDSVELNERFSPPVFVGLLALLGANFVLLFVVSISFGQRTPLPVALAAWLFNLTVFATATFFSSVRLRHLRPLLRLVPFQLNVYRFVKAIVFSGSASR